MRSDQRDRHCALAKKVCVAALPPSTPTLRVGPMHSGRRLVTLDLWPRSVARRVRSRRFLRSLEATPTVGVAASRNSCPKVQLPGCEPSRMLSSQPALPSAKPGYQRNRQGHVFATVEPLGRHAGLGVLNLGDAHAL